MEKLKRRFAANNRIAPTFLLPAAISLLALFWPMCRYLERLVSEAFGRGVLLSLVGLAMTTVLSYSLPEGKLRSTLHAVGEWFYPLFLTALLPLLALDICYYFNIEVPPEAAVWGIVAVCCILTAAGLRSGIGLKTRRYNVSVPGAEKTRAVLISDLHLGCFTPDGFGRGLAEAILKEKPDLVLIAGDLFDDRFEALPEKRRARFRADFAALTAAVPVYAAEGNHDLLTFDPRKESFLKSCGIRMLHDESVCFASARWIFRRDVRNPLRKEIKELLPAGNKAPAVVIDHNPNEHKEAWASGAALVLSGHTHGGQTFPGTLICKKTKGYGFYAAPDTNTGAPRQLIVTSGAGFYGCPVRLGAAREIAVVEVNES